MSRPRSTPSGQADYRKVADTMKVVGNPYQLDVLRILAEGERSSGEIAAEQDASPSVLSNRLAILKLKKFVVMDRRKNRVVYSLSDEGRHLVRIVQAFIRGAGI